MERALLSEAKGNITAPLENGRTTYMLLQLNMLNLFSEHTGGRIMLRLDNPVLILDWETPVFQAKDVLINPRS